VYAPRGRQFYTGGFDDVSPPATSSTGYFRFPSTAATLGYRAFQPQQQQLHQHPHQRRRPDLQLMTTRTCYSLDTAQTSSPLTAGRMTLDMR